MKQLAQNIKKNSLTLEELPVPVCKSGGRIGKNCLLCSKRWYRNNEIEEC